MSKITRKLPEMDEKLPFKIIFYNADKRTPKLHSAKWHAKRHSNRVLVLVAFTGFKNTHTYRIGTYIKGHQWSVEGMSGQIHVAAWGYMPGKMANLFNSL